MMQSMGKILILAGICLLVVGLFIWLFGDFLGWFGNLPGDIKIKKENFHFYFPITTMILISIVLSLLLWLIQSLTR